MIALADGNNFFVACERVFAPALSGRAVVVLSNNDGCVVSRSNEAKALGVGMGQPAFELKPLLRQGRLIACSANFRLYADLSRRMFAVMEQLAPAVAVHSIDEAFLDLGGDPAGAVASATLVRQQVARCCGLPVAVGIAPTKTLAKLANGLAKKTTAGVLCWPDAATAHAAAGDLPVEEVWGIGGRLGATLRADGIATVAALAAADPLRLRPRFGVHVARTALELSGSRCLPWLAGPSSPQSLMVSRSFGTPSRARGEMRQAVATFAAQACAKLRRQGQLAAAAGVWLIQGVDHQHARTWQDLRPLPVPSDSEHDLLPHLLRQAEALFRADLPCRKVGVLCTGLVAAAHGRQTSLLAAAAGPDRERLGGVIDAVNHRFRAAGLLPAAALPAPGARAAWRSRQAQASTVAPGDWDGLPVAW